MQAVERLSSYITQGVYTVSGPFHPFGGAVDIIVVEQQDGSFKCSPWYVRFGKFQGVLNAREKVVNISVNGAEAGFHMYLDNKGEAYFLKGSDPDDEELVSSPPTSGDETDEGSDSKGERSRKNQGCDFESKRTESISQIDVENVKIVARTNSKRSRIFGLVFGRRSTKEDPANQNVPRLNSLERAEIAADLLETKWSTNLPTTNLRDRKAQSTSAVKVDKETNTVGEQKSSAVSLRSEDLGSPEEVKNLISGAEVVNQEVFGEVKDQVPSSLRAHNEIIEICRSEKGDMVGRHEVFSDLPHDANTHEFDSGLENSAGSTENDTGFQSSEFGMLCDGTEKVSEDQELKLIARSSVEEDRDREEASYIFYEAFQTETVRFNVAHHQTIEPSATSLDKNDVAKSTGEVVFETIELVSEVVPGSVTSASGVEEKPANSSEHGSIERPAAGNNVQEDCVHGGNFMNETACRSLEPYISDAEQIEAESPLDMRSLNYESTSEATQQEISKDERTCEKSGEDVKSVDVFENQLKVDTKSGNCHSHRTCFEVAQPFGASEESQCMPIFPISISSGCEEIRDVTEGVKTDTHNLSGEVSIAASPGFNAGLSGIEAENASHSLSKLPEADLFLFSDVDNHGIDGISSQFINEEEVDSEEPMCAPEEGAEEHELNNINSEYSMNLYEPKKSQTSPIDIPCRTQWEETDRKIRSLPNVPSQILQMGTSDVCQPLSRSVQLSSQISDLGICKEEFPSSLKLEAGYGSNLPEAEAASETADVDVNQPSSITKNLNAVGPAVELSLCKHLLFEGMGAEAASRAFDAEKVDLEKFTALGPSVVKNNRLIVRIGGRYLSWDEAQYVILGMVSFGKDHIFDFEGIKVEKTPDEGTSSAIAPSGGSWRLWPFSFKKSRTLRIEHNIPRENKEKDAITASEDGLSGLSKAAQPRPIKRRERSLTPSSRQLASLNLREGRNLVTFSFETAMLGRQQVDARIYLWKWNTRVVISDVDGTITKSDVLGQFMPLVGKDWSQTGVVHLFSSIKENGYQFLFLSARAIAQAYITRQFLFNLKQDGKALPDGPVVISPDGLFPSLYREVIRRAPHEFKIACLEDIRALFPPDCNPFYAGFGNRHTDEISYLKVGIPKGKIFIINPKGEVAVNSRLDMKSYTSLNALVNGMFPPTTSVEQEDFNSWNYWKLPLPVVDC